MLDLINTNISKEQRRELALRAIYTQPYFYKLAFPVVAGTEKENEFGQAVGVNRDFYLTGIQADFGEAEYVTGTEYSLAIWTNYIQNVYRCSGVQKLPTALQAYEARFVVPFASQKFDDRQFEITPLLIRNNDKIFASIRNLAQKQERFDDINLVLKGFNLVPNVFLSDTETRQLNASLAAPVTPQFFRFNVQTNGRQSHVVSNDITPRVILGFGVRNADEAKALTAQARVSIRDLSRQLSLTDTDIPLEFIAPRQTCLRDQHHYYLPVEYYWQPFARLEFSLDVDLNDGDGFEFSILTRNV